MAAEVSTIQSLRAVDAWIDVINANINGGVRTAFKTSRLKFGGSNTNVDRAGTSTSLPLQFPEPSLTTTNSVIDFTQGAITASTENTHLALQGDGWFMVASPDAINTSAGSLYGFTNSLATAARVYLTRDGEFHTNQYGMLVNSNGYYLVTCDTVLNGTTNVLNYSTSTGTTAFASLTGIRAVYNDMDSPAATPASGGWVRLTDFVSNTITRDGNDAALGGFAAQSIAKVSLGQQSLKYTSFGSTVFDFGYNVANGTGTNQIDVNISIAVGTTSDASILSKSLEASNASMTQSVPELSLAQKLFSALTKIIQTHQTNTDAVINLIR